MEIIKEIIYFLLDIILYLGQFLIISIIIGLFGCSMQRLYHKVIYSKKIRPDYGVWLWIGMIISYSLMPFYYLISFLI